MTWIKILWVAKKLNCTTVGKVCWKNVYAYHRSYWQSGNKITPYIVATFEWYKILFAMIIHEGYKKAISVLSKFIQHFYQDIAKNKLTVTNRWNNPYLLYVCIIQFQIVLKDWLIQFQNYIYVCPDRWMNACMFVYEYDSYQDMCSFYDILFNVLPLTMANNLFS